MPGAACHSREALISQVLGPASQSELCYPRPCGTLWGQRWMVSYFSDGPISEKSYRLASLLKISECSLKDKRIYVILFTFMRNLVFPKCHRHYPLARTVPSGDCSQFRELVSVYPAPLRTWALLFLGSLSPELLPGREAVLKSWGIWGDSRYRL